MRKRHPNVATSSDGVTANPPAGYPDMTAYQEYLRPMYVNGDVVLEVECGDNNGLLYLSKLCQGSKGPCIYFRDMWLTPNEFQYVSGRETAKDWKRSIRHHGKSMKLLLSKGILAVHPPSCDCNGCRISCPVNRGRLADKRIITSASGELYASNEEDDDDGLPATVVSSPEQYTSDSNDTCSNQETPQPQPQPLQQPNNNGITNGGETPEPGDFSNYIEEIKALIETNRNRTMDFARKTNHRDSHSPEPRRESRLTSIIDQLLINKAKDLHQEEHRKSLTQGPVGEERAKFQERNSPEANISSPLNCRVSPGTSPVSDRRDTSGRISRADTQVSEAETERLPDERISPYPASTTTEQADSGSSGTEEDYLDHRVSPASGSVIQPWPGSSSPRGRKRSCRAPQQHLSPSSSAEGTGAGDPWNGTSGCLDNFGSKGQQPTPSGASSTSPQTPPATSAAAESLSGSTCTVGRACGDMPTDSLSAVQLDPPVKTERLSPDLESSSSPSISPHLPSPARAFAAAAAAASLGVNIAGLRVAPAAPFSPASLTCAAPALKQMEMMTRNYSDFMRSLAAKYNNQNNQDSFPFGQTNGLIRSFDSSFPFKTSTPPLLGGSRNTDQDASSRKSDSHSSPPALSDHRSTPFQPMADFSSSQTLLNLVRTASAQSASQLENYLRGAVKRPLEGADNRTDPLDLSSKRLRTDSPGSSPHSSRLQSPGVRDLRDVLSGVKVESDDSAVSPGRGSGNKKTPWMSLLDGRGGGHRQDSRTPPKSSGRCGSLCTDQSCSTKSDATEVSRWTVEDVVKFVTSVDSCAEHAEKFREQSIDGTSLPLLTEEHLTLYMGMRLGPALKLKSTLAKKIGHCTICMHCIHCHGDEQERRREPSPSVSK